MSEVSRLSTGAEMRVRGAGPLAVVCVNGGQRDEVAGTWSASLEWLVHRLAPSHPRVLFAEVRYRIKSWKRLDSCIDDCLAAIEAAGGQHTVLLGYSMGGAVAIAAAGSPSVTSVVGLAPWIPDRLSLFPLDGRRLTVIHGMLDRWLPWIPGVSTGSSRRGFERARAQGIEGSYTVIPGALHGIALRAPTGALLPLPRAGRWAQLVAGELTRFEWTRS